MRARMQTVAIVLLCGMFLEAILGGCASRRDAASGRSETDAAEAVDILTGTAWQLVEIQSMSDEIGTTRPEDPSLYTLSFGPGGTVSMRLNCNRATGTWSATPASANGGTIEFGPLASTRAMCPPPSLDERIAKDFTYVRSYIIEGDRLFLSLMADAAIYAWERMPGGLD